MIPMSSRQRAALDAASRDRLSLGSACPFVLTIGGVDYTRLIGEEGYLRIPPQEGPAVVLEGRVAARLPSALEGAECRVEHVVRGERIESYLGRIDWIKARGYYSDFLAATGSRDAEDTNLGDGPEDDLEYRAAAPSSALYEAASRLRDSYRGIEIPRVATPLFTRSSSAPGDAPFRWTDKVSELYEAIRTDSGLAAEDTPLNVLGARPVTSVLSEAVPAWTFEEGRDFDHDGLSVEPREEARYARVSGYRMVAGAPVVAGPKGGAKVDTHGRAVRKDSTLLMDLSDSTEEEAYAAVYRKALELSENPLLLSFPCIYAPFWLERGDPVLVRGKEITAAGTHLREYRARLTSNAPDLWEREGQLRAMGGLASETFVPRRRRAVAVRPTAYRPPLGFNHLGEPYLSGGLPWVTPDPDGIHVRLNVALAREMGVELLIDPTDEGAVVIRA